MSSTLDEDGVANWEAVSLRKAAEATSEISRMPSGWWSWVSPQRIPIKALRYEDCHENSVSEVVLQSEIEPKLEIIPRQFSTLVVFWWNRECSDNERTKTTAGSISSTSSAHSCFTSAFHSFLLLPPPPCFSNLLLQQDSLAEQSFHTFSFFAPPLPGDTVRVKKKQQKKTGHVLFWFHNGLCALVTFSFFFQKTSKNTALTAYITTRWCWCLHSVWLHTSGFLFKKRHLLFLTACDLLPVRLAEPLCVIYSAAYCEC